MPSETRCLCVNVNHGPDGCQNMAHMHRFCGPCQSEGAIERPPEPAGWISAKERLPEPGAWFVWIITSQHRDFDTHDIKNVTVIRPGYPNDVSFNLISLATKAGSLDRVHWMPLPEPPPDSGT